MKTYTFKIKVSQKKVVCACNMQLEQFYESVKMTEFNKLLERYPYTYITASDYVCDGGGFVSLDTCICDLKSLMLSKDLKSWLSSDDFVGFIDDVDFKNDLERRIFMDAETFEEASNVGNDTSVEE